MFCCKTVEHLQITPSKQAFHQTIMIMIITIITIVITVTLPAHDELGTCEANLAPPQQCVLSILVSRLAD